MSYDRMKAAAYAHQWAFKRNPRYLSFTGIGGDCTNFISQCILAGGAAMNYTRTFGWYYNSANDRAPAWTGVQYLYNFLTRDRKRASNAAGPYAGLIKLEEIEMGDIVQLSFDGIVFTHSLLVVETGLRPDLDNTLTATHTIDSDYRPLSSYTVAARRYLKILA